MNKKYKKFYYIGKLITKSPVKQYILKSKYPSTMSDDLFEHFLSLFLR